VHLFLAGSPVQIKDPNSEYEFISLPQTKPFRPPYQSSLLSSSSHPHQQPPHPHQQPSLPQLHPSSTSNPSRPHRQPSPQSYPIQPHPSLKVAFLLNFLRLDLL